MPRSDRRFLNGEFLTFCVTAILLVGAISAAYAVSQYQLDNHEKRLTGVETNVNQNENLLIEIKTDVRWMRSQMTHAMRNMGIPHMQTQNKDN